MPGRFPATRWLRQLDRDAFAGLLWRRRVFYVPALTMGGVLVGVSVGFAAAFALALGLPSESEVLGPDGASMTVPNDYTAIPFLGGLLGAGLGLAVGAVLAVRRWRQRSGRP